MKLLCCIFFLTCAGFLRAQISLDKFVAEASTHAPVPYAYAYLTDARRTGTITNSDGRFLLSGARPSDTLVVSHIGYMPYRVAVAEIKSDTLFVTEKINTLAEVTILGVDSLSLYQRVKASMEKNHKVEPIMYEVFARSFQYDEPRSELYTLQEMAMQVHHDAKQNVKVNFERARSRLFAAEDKSVSYHLTFELLVPFQNNIWNWEIWEKNMLKNYTLTIAGSTVQDGRSLLQLVFTLKADSARVSTLYIDEQSYAVVRYNYTYGEGKVVHDTFFREIHGKWYLAYSTSYARRVHNPKKGPSFASGHEQVWVYNLSENEVVTGDFKGYLAIGAEVIPNWDKNLSPWDHPFWQTYRSIPLPGWIQAVVEGR